MKNLIKSHKINYENGKINPVKDTFSIFFSHSASCNYDWWLKCTILQDLGQQSSNFLAIF